MKHIAITFVALAALSAQAQTIKPGVWETSSKVSTADLQTSAALDMASFQRGHATHHAQEPPLTRTTLHRAAHAAAPGPHPFPTHQRAMLAHC